MSHDGTYIVIRKGQLRAYYSRWGALSLHRDLLVGTGPFVGWVESLETSVRPFLERWLCGLVIVDFDHHEIAYWADQFVGNNAVDQRIHRAVMAERWRGWRLRWLQEPSGWLQTLLRETLPKHEFARPEPTLDDFLARQEEPWLLARESSKLDLDKEIAELGELTVRSWFEFDTHRSWVCVRDEHGSIRDAMLSDPEGDLMRLGPPALEALDLRPSTEGTTAAIFEEHQSWCYFIDTSAKTFRWWSASPPWRDHPAGALPLAWPGWSVHAMLDGPRETMHEAALDVRVFDYDEKRAQHLPTWERLLGERPTGAGVLASVSKSMQLQDGERLVVTDPGLGDCGPTDADHLWKVECWEVVQRLLDEL